MHTGLVWASAPLYFFHSSCLHTLLSLGVTKQPLVKTKKIFASNRSCLQKKSIEAVCLVVKQVKSKRSACERNVWLGKCLNWGAWSCWHSVSLQRAKEIQGVCGDSAAPWIWRRYQCRRWKRHPGYSALHVQVRSIKWEIRETLCEWITVFFSKVNTPNANQKLRCRKQKDPWYLVSVPSQINVDADISICC